MKVAELEGLLEFSRNITSVINEDELFSLVFNDLRVIMEFDLAFAIVYSEHCNILYQCNRIKLPSHTAERAKDRCLSIFNELNNLSLNADCFKVKVFNLPKKVNDFHGASIELKSLLVAEFPILDGAILLFSRQNDVYSDESKKILNAIAGQINNTLQRLMYMKKVEKTRLQAIIESMQEGVVILNLKGGIVLVNPSGKAFLKMLKAPSKPGQKLRQLASHSIVVMMRELDSNGSAIAAKRFVRRDICLQGEEQKIISLTLSAVNGAELDHGSYMLVFRDITEERTAQEQLFMTTKLASLGELAAGVAHEINNPLTSVMGYAQLHLMSQVDAELREDLQRIYDEGKRAQTIVKSLLAFARDQTDEDAEMDLNQTVAEVLKLFGKQLTLKNIRLITHFEDNLPKIYGNSNEIQQVVLNLIQNACDAIFDSQKGSFIKIATRRKAGERLELSVVDDGPGMPESVREKAFNPFFTTKTAGKGTGLGLSISYKIIKKHGGQIVLRSWEGKGTRFCIELPIMLTPNQSVN
ncbi:MAG: nitrogen regulation protein NR(II) [bacterium]